MKPKKQATSVTSFAKKHVDNELANNKYSKHRQFNSKTELDYYEDYPHLIPPFALSDFAKKMAAYGDEQFHSPLGIHTPGSNLVLPHGSIPGNMTNMAYGGLLAPLQHPNKKKLE